jgi:hypothetical protein
MDCIYTKDELLIKIKAIDTKLESAVNSSKLDTNQASQSFQVDITKLTDQRNWYYRQLQQFYPGDYGDIVVLNTDRR